MMTSGKYVPQYFTQDTACLSSRLLSLNKELGQDGQLYQEIEGAPCPERARRLHLLAP